MIKRSFLLCPDSEHAFHTVVTEVMITVERYEHVHVLLLTAYRTVFERRLVFLHLNLLHLFSLHFDTQFSIPLFNFFFKHCIHDIHLYSVCALSTKHDLVCFCLIEVLFVIGSQTVNTQLKPAARHHKVVLFAKATLRTFGFIRLRILYGLRLLNWFL